MITYLTIAVQPSGIYVGQVIDVCEYLSEKSNKKVKLIALISIRNFSAQKRIIKSNYSNSVVLPMIPKLRFWKWNILYLIPYFIFRKKAVLMGRSALATSLGLQLKRIGLLKKVIYDGRAAEYAEIEEYNVVEDKKVAKDILQAEKKAVLSSDFKIAVSNKLVEYWKTEYAYFGNNHTIIPCTLSKHHVMDVTSVDRKELGFNATDVILIYAGSVAGWQSFGLMDNFFRTQLEQNENVRVILLSKKILQIEELIKDYPGKVVQKWCKPHEVVQFLNLADYGILIRDSTITNKVASPVKFAEYLAAGLKIIISANIGDYPSFVVKQNVGSLVNEINQLIPIDKKDRIRNKEIAQKYFTKNSDLINQRYQELLKVIYN